MPLLPARPMQTAMQTATQPATQTATQTAAGRMQPMGLRLHVHVDDKPPSECMAMTGSCKALGEWSPRGGVPLEWRGDKWATRHPVSLDPCQRVEFKFVRMGPDEVVEWEAGTNRSLETPVGDTELELIGKFNGNSVLRMLSPSEVAAKAAADERQRLGPAVSTDAWRLRTEETMRSLATAEKEVQTRREQIAKAQELRAETAARLQAELAEVRREKAARIAAAQAARAPPQVAAQPQQPQRPQPPPAKVPVQAAPAPEPELDKLSRTSSDTDMWASLRAKIESLDSDVKGIASRPRPPPEDEEEESCQPSPYQDPPPASTPPPSMPPLKLPKTLSVPEVTGTVFGAGERVTATPAHAPEVIVATPAPASVAAPVAAPVAASAARPAPVAETGLSAYAPSAHNRAQGEKAPILSARTQWTQALRKEEPPRCGNGHVLAASEPGIDTPFSSHACDTCGRSGIRSPEMIYRCDLCNYDLCRGCAGKAPTLNHRSGSKPAAAPAPSASTHAPPVVQRSAAPPPRFHAGARGIGGYSTGGYQRQSSSSDQSPLGGNTPRGVFGDRAGARNGPSGSNPAARPIGASAGAPEEVGKQAVVETEGTSQVGGFVASNEVLAAFEAARRRHAAEKAGF